MAVLLAPLATSSDHDRYPRTRNGLWDIEQPLRLEMTATDTVFRAALALPYRVSHLKRLLEHLETSVHRGEREPEPFRLRQVPTRSEAEPGPSTGEHIERVGGLYP